MAMSDFLEASILNHILTATAYASPNATLALALFTADPTDANLTAGEVDVGVDDTAYARQSITFAAATSGVGTSISTDAQTFAAVVYGSGGVQYDVTHFAIYDQVALGGNLLYHAPLAATVTRLAGKTLVFDIGNVTVAQS